MFRQYSREGKHNLIQESSPRKHLSSILKSLTLGISQSRHREEFANLLSNYVNLVFTTFKIKNIFKVKGAVPEGLRTRVV